MISFCKYGGVRFENELKSITIEVITRRPTSGRAKTDRRDISRLSYALPLIESSSELIARTSRLPSGASSF